MDGGFGRWKDEGRAWKTPVDAHRRPEATATSATSCCPRSAPRARPSCSAPRCCCSAPAASARRPRCTSPRPASARSASSTWTRSTPPTCSARSSTTSTASATARSTRRRRRSSLLNPDVDVVTYDTRLSADNIIDIIDRLRRHRRRRRQLPVALPAQRRQREARHPGRPRLDLPLRGDGQRVPPAGGPDLPRHGARAAARRAGPELRRGRRARRAARHRRLDPGPRDDQGAARPRRAADRADPRRSTRPT